MRAAAMAALMWVALGAPFAWADDCTDTGDCAMAPRNIDAATAVAAAGPFVALAWVYLSRRNGAGAAVAAAVPPDADTIAANLAAVKDEFERLQEQLRDRAVNEIRELDAFMRKYDEKWREGMFALEDYLEEYQNLLPGLQKIWEQMGSREDARRIAEIVDEGIMLAQIGIGLAGSAGGTAAREAIAVGRRTGVRAEAEAVRRAAREALGREVQAAQAAERAAARSVERGAERNAAEIANDVRRAVQEGRGTGKLILADDLAGHAARIPPKPGYFDVIIHGDRNTVSILKNGKWIDVSPRGLRIIMESQGYTGGPVRLISCETGGKVVGGRFQQGVAGALSRELKAPVIAPSETAWVRGNGTLWSSEAQYGKMAHWTSHGMREYGLSSGALTAEEARLLGYLP